MEDVRVIHGDCLAVLPTLEAGSVDAVITDPPYPCIKRDYGTWTEGEWFSLIDPVVEQCRRVLKPTGSAVFILQPNSERVGRMRTWLWEFMARWGREWGIVQDAWWWNTSALPLGGACKADLMRPSLKACVWLGGEDCWRDQGAVLLPESARNEEDRLAGRFEKGPCPSRKRSETEGKRDDWKRIRLRVAERGGSTPHNVLPAGGASPTSGGTTGHSAATPLALCRWWARYICPPGGAILDPFAGSGTVGLAALREGRKAILIEKHAPYIDIINRRLAQHEPLFRGAAQ